MFETLQDSRFCRHCLVKYKTWNWTNEYWPAQKKILLIMTSSLNLLTCSISRNGLMPSICKDLTWFVMFYTRMSRPSKIYVVIFDKFTKWQIRYKGCISLGFWAYFESRMSSLICVVFFTWIFILFFYVEISCEVHAGEDILPMLFELVLTSHGKIVGPVEQIFIHRMHLCRVVWRMKIAIQRVVTTHRHDIYLECGVDTKHG